MTAQWAEDVGSVCYCCMFVFSYRTWLKEAVTEQTQRTWTSVFLLVWGFMRRTSVSWVSYSWGSLQILTPLPAFTDFSDSNSTFDLDSPPLKLDHCDLLLDAMDAQLSLLQVCDCRLVLFYSFPKSLCMCSGSYVCFFFNVSVIVVCRSRPRNVRQFPERMTSGMQVIYVTSST